MLGAVIFDPRREGVTDASELDEATRLHLALSLRFTHLGFRARGR
jgi:hypothetical protein